MYNYYQSVKTDVMNWIDENRADIEAQHDKAQYICDSVFVDDNVTGNASGSYTFSRREAKENYFGDEKASEYLENMCEEGFASYEEVGKAMVHENWETIDVLIRCYLVNGIVMDCLEEEEAVEISIEDLCKDFCKLNPGHDAVYDKIESYPGYYVVYVDEHRYTFSSCSDFEEWINGVVLD